jgi:polyhydroxyalkanoate synthesis regulator phasin
MTTDQSNEGQNKKHHEPGTMYEVTRRILLAATGAMALAQDEIEDFVTRLVDRGEIAEKEGRQLMKEILEKRKEKRKIFVAEVHKRFRDRMERLDMPTKKDIEELSSRIAELTRQVEELKKSKE